MSNPKDGDNDGKDKGKSNLITFPGGQKVDPTEVGADAVIGSTGNIPTPELQDPADIQAEVRERATYIKSQELVKIVTNKGTTSETIDALLIEIAEETAHLKFERDKAIKDGKNTANFNVARINSLRSMTEILLKRKEADLGDHLDLKSPKFQKVFQVWMEFFYEAMEKSGITSDIIDLVFKQMKADMINWEQRMDVSAN
jgi:hypothetical protein